MRHKVSLSDRFGLEPGIGNVRQSQKRLDRRVSSGTCRDGLLLIVV
jgi:hypothetical protein